ncbi:HNH endonuclease [Sphingobacterium endophyticum]|uniref:HNH endonuclease n=1 Tax=Sphingobacterium endophyticum TaxID=2546448 RepID=UPI0012E1A601|nr:HNH endonuclease [Sphingobacterium endophyticum]
MRRIELSNDLIKRVEDFNNKIFTTRRLTGHNPFVLPLRGLIKLFRDVTTTIDQRNYIRKLYKEYNQLLNLKPSEFTSKKNEFDAIYYIDGVKNSPSSNFGKKVVEALRYDAYRESEYPKILNELGWNLKTCFYCNYSGTITVLNNHKYTTFYDLDHVMPKSIFPFLATSFFNFIPSCANCNRNKTNKIIPNLNPFFEAGEANTKLERVFKISNKSKVEFYVSNNKVKIAIEVENTINNINLNDYSDITDLKLLYNTQKHEVEEILWKKKIYSQTYINDMKKIFSRFYLDKNQLNRILWGTDLDENTINDKPLAKFKFDLIVEK